MFGARERTLSPWRAERILFNEEGLLVVDKQPGIVVHGGREGLGLSLVERLAAFRASSGETYLGVHSRLDVGTSGALLFTTDPARNAAIRQSLEAGTLRRSYVALVSLRPRTELRERGTLAFSLAFERGRASVGGSSGKPSVTHYRVVARHAERALVELELETGRTHQIRASLAHVGAPIVGDELYGGPSAPRIFLHAQALSGPPLMSPIVAPVPLVFGEWLEQGQISFPVDARELESRLFDAMTLRAPLLSQCSTIRLIDSARDLLPGLVIDVAGGIPWIEATPEIERAPLDSLLRRLGFDSTDGSGDILGQEGPLRFQIARGERPPLLVDAREARASLFETRARTVLSLGCGPAQLGVAASIRAQQGVHVDERARFLELWKRSYDRSGIDRAGHRFFREDPLRYLEKAVRRGERFDLVIIDASKLGGTRLFSRTEETLRLSIRCLTSQGTALIWAGEESSRVRSLRRALENASRAEGAILGRVRPVPLPHEWGSSVPGGIEASLGSPGKTRL